MTGNLYGLDYKITLKESMPEAIIIEGNGSNFGTDFFKYEEGLPYLAPKKYPKSFDFLSVI